MSDNDSIGELKPCPDCGGTGGLADPFTSQIGDQETPDFINRCDSCNGTGKVMDQTEKENPNE